MDLYVCDNTFRRLALVDDYISMTWTDRYTKAGDIKVVFNIDSPNLDHIELDRVFAFTPSDSHMIIESTITDYEKNTITVVGRCLKSILDRRLNRNHVLQPAAIEESAAGAATKSVRENCLTTAIVDDRFQNFIIGDHFLPWGGGPNSMRDNGAKDVYSEVVSIVDEALVGWKLEYRESYTYASGSKQYDKLVFHCYVGSDRTIGNGDGNGEVVFDPTLDNISSVNHVRSHELHKNVIGVRWGSNGTGWTNYFAAGYPVDRYNINRRVGMFTPDVTTDQIGDNRDQTIKAYGRAEAARTRPINVMDGTMLSDGPFEYGWHYFLGDLVTVGHDKRTRQKGRIIEYIWNNDANGWSHYPTFKIVEE